MNLLTIPFLAILTIFTTTQILAGEENGQYTMYKCDNTENCTGNCIPNGTRTSFLVDKTRGVVMAIFYKNNEMSSSTTFKECSAVFNSENWDCSLQPPMKGGVLLMERKMTNNKYIARSRAFYPDKGTVTVLSDVCAKL